MTKLPFKLLVDGAEHITHGGIGRISGKQLTIEGRRRGELPAEINPFLKVTDDQKQRFHVVRVPLAENTSWIETLRKTAASGDVLSIDEKYFAADGYVVGKEIEEITIPVRPGELYRVHYVGKDNGSGDQILFCSQCRYTTDEENGFDSQKARTATRAFGLQEVLYLGLLHLGVKLYEFPRAVGKEFGITIDQQILNEGAIVQEGYFSIDTTIGFIFGGSRGAFHTNPNGIPLEKPSSERLRRAKARIIEYLSK